jgi:hypothetical protein
VFDFDVKVMHSDGAAVLKSKKEVRNYNSERIGIFLPLLLKELPGSQTGFFLEIGVKNCFRVKATFIGQTFYGNVLVFLGFGIGLKGFNPVLIDKLIEVKPDTVI